MAKYVGLDIGSKTIGIAISEGFIANSHSTIRFEENDFKSGAQKLKDFLEADGFEKLIIGYPFNMNGSSGYRIEMVEEFIENLKLFININDNNLVKIDERLTSRMAKSIMIEANLSRKKQKSSKDQLAAQLILETFLNNNN
ncbi:Holliday junction resolvase RuvX [Spiroplasma tabanidicola]|uniref:Putative pre-16S rRNA nuclease n=1 Tax=Spiroplasma tabanidicola TaxID=324079 RepID=A0A6I6C770_9MOLU|nr:Holliday junction resolvase RuvX [Spiroplasma tabanidicola]QGS51646.1 putative holliday junction resolvase [Spiroplasma tabanidicola]